MSKAQQGSSRDCSQVAPGPSATARRSRPENSSMEEAVLTAARNQLSQVGPAALSLRAIAREVGVVPSALYRYFPSRESILTALIRTAYQSLADHVIATESAVERADYLGRWRATFAGAREWAIAHPHEYALLYGTPVAGYQAPEDTVVPATRVTATLAEILGDAGLTSPTQPQPALDPTLAADVTAMLPYAETLGIVGAEGTDPQQVLLVIDAWTTLFGAISFELFGQYANSIEHHAEYLDRLALRAASAVGLT